MKAIVVEEYGSEEVLELKDIPVPSVGNDEILVSVKAAGVNPVDTYVREGNHISAPPVPFTPGKDGAGVVEQVGDAVSGISPGDRVYLAGSVSGTYAEFALAKRHQVQPLPEGVSFEKGAGVFVPCATAYRALFHKGHIEAGMKVLIHGASGAVGLAAVQFAKQVGATVVGTAGSEKGKEVVKEAGADFVSDHSEDGYRAELVESVGRVNLVIEMLANVNLVTDFEVIEKGAAIVVVGSRGSLDFDPRLTMTADATIRGMSLFNASETDFAEIFQGINEGLSNGFLSPLIDKAFPLKEAGDAHRYVIGNRSAGKVVLAI